MTATDAPTAPLVDEVLELLDALAADEGRDALVCQSVTPCPRLAAGSEVLHPCQHGRLLCEPCHAESSRLLTEVLADIHAWATCSVCGTPVTGASWVPL